MSDVYGYQAYHRLRRGWKLLSLALFGLASAALLLSQHGCQATGNVVLLAGLAFGAWGGLLAASGTSAGWFRKNCLIVALNFVCLLLVSGSTSWLWGFPWLSLLGGLWLADRGLRSEIGMSRGPWLVPPGCIMVFLLLPFFWPVALFFATLCLSIYLVFTYCFLAGAMPRAEDLTSQLDDPHFQAMDAITRR
ncbi:hypothetical protein JST97_24130 [bacterium]|nr:hypothetical protein [bacterium]